MSKFFIDRPIFAWVIALVIMLVGGLSILKLPINQYPSIAPPAIAIAVSYPGGSAQTVQDTVVQVIEQQLNGKPASGLAVKLATGANALDTAKALRQTISDLEPFFPPGVQVVFPYDTTPVVSASISGVIHTLLEAVALVFLVMYLFLQNLHATLITTMTMPVVLLGTFGVLAAFGFSINTLTMFGMVLAIGLLVDDAIVVVENVERVMSEEGLSPKEATKNPWARSRAPWSVSPWCCRRCCCR